MTDALDSLPPLRDIISTHDLRATKSLGQNFLLDQNLTDKIARQALPFTDSDHILEIGPGPGGLTRSILRAGAPKLTAIEYDPRAVNALQSLVDVADDRLSIIEGDALKINLDSQPNIIIANLPYNIATPLIINWLTTIHKDPSSIRTMVLMVQREVAERLSAPLGHKHYGRLSVMTNWLCHTEICFDVPPSAFVPPPKVISSVIRFTPKIVTAPQPDFRLMEDVVATAFNQRRKMVRQSLKKYADKLEACGIDPTARAENLSIDQYKLLSLAST